MVMMFFVQIVVKNWIGVMKNKQIPNKVNKTEITLSKRKFATELKQLVHKKCAEINHYVSGCNSPFSYLQIADVQESLREIENTLNIKIKE